MDKKKTAIRLIESYINDQRKEDVESMYGKGTQIKIHNIDFTISNPSVLIESVILLGEEINEEVMDRDLADILIQDALVYFYSDLPIKVSIRWDV